MRFVSGSHLLETFDGAGSSAAKAGFHCIGSCPGCGAQGGGTIFEPEIEAGQLAIHTSCSAARTGSSAVRPGCMDFDPKKAAVLKAEHFEILRFRSQIYAESEMLDYLLLMSSVSHFSKASNPRNQEFVMAVAD